MLPIFYVSNISLWLTFLVGQNNIMTFVYNVVSSRAIVNHKRHIDNHNTTVVNTDAG